MYNFEMAELALKCACPSNAFKYDDKEMPSIFVYIPKFRLCDVLSTEDTRVHPAFKKNGTEINGFYVGKFLSRIYNGRAYSLPGENPEANASYNTCVESNHTKGNGFHEITAAEWAAIALWCHKNGCEPRGNNNFGKDSLEATYKAIPAVRDGSGKTLRVATGTGPITWSHDKTLEGIWDLNGNVREWITGIRLVKGELQIIADNNAADPNCDLSATSSAWKAIRASDGALVNPNGQGTTSGTIKLDYISNKWCYSKNKTNEKSIKCKFKDFYCDSTIGSAAKLLLQSLALLPDTDLTGDGIDADYGADTFLVNNSSDDVIFARGGTWQDGETGGIFHVTVSNSRTSSGEGSGCRSAFCDE